MIYKFIAFEGIDGAGKTTQARLLANHLATLGYDVVQIAADRDEHCRLIRNAIAKNQIVVCDRFSASSFAYQVYAGDVLHKDLERIDEIATREELKPDLYIWLDCSINLIKDRVKEKGESFDIEYMRKVQRGYKLYFTTQSYRHNIIKINSALPIHQIHEIIKAKLNV